MWMADQQPKDGRLVRHVRQVGVRVAGLLRTGAGAFNLAVAAAVLVWLAAAITFFLSLPYWISMTTVAAALGVGFAHAAKFRLGPSLVVALCIVAVGIASYAVGHNGDDSAKGPQTAPLVAVLGGVHASLEVKNETFGRNWGRTIGADGNDELQFRLVIKNPGPTPSYPLVIRILARENSEEPREIDICFARSESGPFEEGPIVKVVPQSNGLGEFSSWRPQIGFPSPVATRLASLGGQEWDTQGSRYQAEDYTVPALSAHQRLVITFSGSFLAPDSAQIDGGSLQLKNLSGHQGDYEAVTAAWPGDLIQAYYMLHNSGFRSTNVFARVRMASHEAGLFEWVSVYVRENGGVERELGHGVVNASGDEPIELSVLPGTTELRAADTECSEETRHPLPDGVTKGGLELGPIGGFEPRDPCQSSELTRYLFFQMRATSFQRRPSSGVHGRT
jgi:hypothetical protein